MDFDLLLVLIIKLCWLVFLYFLILNASKYLRVISVFNYMGSKDIDRNYWDCWTMIANANAARKQMINQFRRNIVIGPFSLPIISSENSYPVKFIPSSKDIIDAICFLQQTESKEICEKNLMNWLKYLDKDIERLKSHIPLDNAIGILTPQLDLLVKLKLAEPSIYKILKSGNNTVELDSKVDQLVEHLQNAIIKYKSQLIQISKTKTGKRCISVDANGELYVDVKLKNRVNVGRNYKEDFAVLFLTIATLEGFYVEGEVSKIDLAKAAFLIFDLEWKPPKSSEFYSAVVSLKHPNHQVKEILKHLKSRD